MFSTDEYEAKMTGAFEHFGEELRKIRTGRAHPGMLAGVMVEAYGASMPLNQVANVTAPEAQMLLVTPFDPSNLQNIAAAIRNDQSLGFNPSDDGRVAPQAAGSSSVRKIRRSANRFAQHSPRRYQGRQKNEGS